MSNYEYFKKFYEYMEEGTLRSITTNKIVGRPNAEGYIRIRANNGKEYRAHRIIWILHYGDIVDDLLIDHIDGNRQNNKISNLRLATRIQNNANKAHVIDNGLPKGVTRVGKKYRARLYHKGINYSLGMFSTPEEAGEAYNKKAIEVHGEFAYHQNFIT